MPLIEFGNGDSGPLASLEVGTRYTTTTFPEDLSESPYFILFRAKKEYRLSDLQQVQLNSYENEYGTQSVFAPGSTVNNIINRVGSVVNKVGGFFETLEGAGVKVSLPSHSFALPIPANLATSYNAQYDTPSLGPLGAAARNIGASFEGDRGSIYSSIREALESSGELNSENLRGVLTNLGVAVAGQADVSAIAGAAIGGPVGAIIGAAAGNVGQGALAGLGIARNPHIANVFTGVNFKTHSFQYKLVAKSKKESDAIRDLIRNFKYHMAPSYAAGDHLFEYPSQFEIQLRAGDYLFEFGDSILTDFTVNYNGEGAPYFFEETNAPYSVTIDMSFKETSIVTKREIRQGR
jgi:hypothetical protein